MAKRDRSTPRDHEIRDQVMRAAGGRFYVNARAGTGKTESLARRVVYALQQEKDGQKVYKPSDMLCVTFTNGAEYEMRRRVVELLSKEGGGLSKEVDSVYIGNVHKFCLRLLWKTGRGVRRFRVVDDISMKSFVSEGSQTKYPTSRGKRKMKSVTDEEVRKYAATLRQAEDKHPAKVRLQYFDRLSADKKAVLENLARQYIAYKREHRFLDFDDILIDTYNLLRDDAVRKEHVYRWIQVDEMQDLNPLQHGIIGRLVADRKSTVCYYGDICQAIYSFLGTRKLPDFGRSGHVFSFTENFRSPDFLVKVFDRYIQTTLRHLPGLQAEAASSPVVRPLERLHVCEYSNDIRERQSISEAVAKILQYNGRNPGRARRRTVAILVRTGEEADAVSRALLNCSYEPKVRKNAAKTSPGGVVTGIPHLKVSGSDSLKRDAIRTLLSHFAVANDEFRRSDWARLLHHLHCASDYSHSLAIASNLHRMGFIPSDFILYDGSTFLREFYKAVSSGCVVVCTEDDTVYAMKYSDGKLQEGMFSGPTAKGGDCLDEFMQYVGNAAVVCFESTGAASRLPSVLRSGAEPFAPGRVWSLRKTARLLRDDESLDDSFKFLTSELKGSPEIPQDAPDRLRRTVALFLRHLCLAKDRLDIQQAYMSNLGAQSLARKIRDVYGPVFLHTRKCLEGKTMKDSDRILADEFRWVYKTLLRKKIIHNVNPWIIDRKMRDYTDGINPYDGSGKFDEENFQKSWTKVIDEDRRQTERKTEYLFDYLQKSVFADGSRKLVRNLLDDHLQEIRFIGESDLCQQPFVKEAVYVMTVHQAKGHEFTDVFITGASNQTYPFYGHKAKWEQDEDRRLFYVAMTRSRNNITITYAREYRGVYDNRLHSASCTPYIEGIRGFFNFESDKKKNEDGASTHK